MPLTSVLDICSLRASSSIGTVMPTYSRNQDTGTLIDTGRPPCGAVPCGHVRGPPRGGEPAEGPGPGGPRREQRVSDVPARHERALELLQVAEVVLIEEPDVGRAGAEHREALDASAEGEALIARRVVADASEDVGMDHAAAGGFDPAVATADVALRIFSFAGEAVECDLRRWLRERKVVDPKTDLAVASEDLPRERIQRPLEVGHRELLVDREALVLEEDRLADRVRRLVAVAASGYHYSDRRLALLHHPHLHRGGVRTSKEWPRRIVAERIRDPERLPFLPGGVAGRNVEGLEGVVVPFDLGTLDRLEAERPEGPRDLADGLRYRVQATDAIAPRRKRHVLALSAEIALQRLRSECGPALVESRLDATLGLVQSRAISRLLCSRKLRDALRGLAQDALPAKVLHTSGLEGNPVSRAADLGARAIRELLQVFAGHVASSFLGNTKPAVRSGRRRASAVPPVFPPRERRTLGRSAIGLHPDRLFCRSASERIRASSARPGFHLCRSLYWRRVSRYCSPSTPL